MTTEHLLAAAALAFFAYIVKGFTGFGAGIVVVPLLSLFLDLKIVVFAACVCAVGNGACLATTSWRNADWRPLAWVLGAALVGLLGGTYALVSLSTVVLKKAFGALVCIMAAHMFLERANGTPESARPWPTWPAPIAGLIGGSILGVFGAGGPAMVLYLAHRLHSKVALRASLIMLFFTIDVFRLGGYVWADLLTPESARLAAWTLPAALLGSYAGTRLQEHVSTATFRKIVSAILLATGLLLIVR